MLAYILVALKEGNEKAVLEEFLALKQVNEAHVLFGEWDLLVKINVDSHEQLSQFIIDVIRPWPDIKMTSTLIVAR